MANVKVSELPAASAASTSQEFEVNDSGTSKKVTGSQIKSFVKDGLVSTDIDGVTSSIQNQLNDKFKQRTITGTADQITVTNGDGVAGNPTIAAVIASQAEAEAGTDATKLMTPQRVRNALNATGSAPVYACRAWVNFNGTGTVAIRASGNVSSITDNGTGDYTVNFTTAMLDANYLPLTSARSFQDNDDNGIFSFPFLSHTNTPSSFRFVVAYKDGGGFGGNTQFDSVQVSVAIFR